jgi:hypothetical protein
MIRVFIIVGLIDPTDNFLSLTTTFPSFCNISNFLCYPGTVPEELLMSMVGINRIKQIHAIAKLEERPSVLVTEVFGLFDSFPQGIDLCSGLRHADNINLIRGFMNMMFKSRPRLVP